MVSSGNLRAKKKIIQKLSMEYMEQAEAKAMIPRFVVQTIRRA